MMQLFRLPKSSATEVNETLRDNMRAQQQVLLALEMYKKPFVLQETCGEIDKRLVNGKSAQTYS